MKPAGLGERRRKTLPLRQNRAILLWGLSKISSVALGVRSRCSVRLVGLSEGFPGGAYS
jgi:hypothetical protein